MIFDDNDDHHQCFGDDDDGDNHGNGDDDGDCDGDDDLAKANASHHGQCFLWGGHVNLWNFIYFQVIRLCDDFCHHCNISVMMMMMMAPILNHSIHCQL